MNEREVPADVFDVAAAHQLAVKDRLLRILAGAVGGHPSLVEQLARLRPFDCGVDASSKQGVVA